jgi:hypothetical protein
MYVRSLIIHLREAISHPSAFVKKQRYHFTGYRNQQSWTGR